ncbi:MtrAB system accessory lipoprotein LpqB [soil metagenome]
MRKASVGFACVLVIALAGCVGIPTGGGIEAGPVIDDQIDPEFIVLPSGPRTGAPQQEILEDFMLALRGPQNDYATARLFLTTDLAETWDPDESTVVRTGIPSTGPGSGPDSLTYTVTATASVDADGRYSERTPAPQTLEYTFIQQDGEWRISGAPNGIVLSQSSFNVVFTERPLYFFDPSHRFLVPDVRWFPSRQTVAVRVLRALLVGPTSWLQGGVLLSAFPIATTLDNTTTRGAVTIESGRATVQLSKEALTASPQERDYMRQQLAAALGIANVVMTVGGIELEVPEPGVAAVINPPVEGPPLVGTDAAFGFDGGDGIKPITDLSDQVVGSGASAVSLSSDKQVAAMLTPAGVSVAQVGAEPVLVDARSGLIAPSVDPFRFVWTVQGGNAATLTTFEIDGAEHPVQSGLPADASIVSADVSRDGARILLYLSTPVGPKLIVAGIVRDTANVPLRLGELVELPVSDDVPVDATWVNDRTVASVARASEVYPVTAFEIGGPSAPIGQLPNAVSIAGGNGGTDGLRVLRSTGEVQRPQGSGGWVDTGITASFLGTKQ